MREPGVTYLSEEIPAFILDNPIFPFEKRADYYDRLILIHNPSTIVVENSQKVDTLTFFAGVPYNFPPSDH